MINLELLHASQGTLSRWSRLHLQSLTPTNPHWARVVGYGPYSLWVIHKEGLLTSYMFSLINYLESRLLKSRLYNQLNFVTS
jgi:hypothetical protein